jgi:hypothetical protein
MGVSLPLTGSGDATASVRTRNGATVSGTHAQAVDLDRPSSAAVTRVGTTDTSVTILAANAARARATIVNESAERLAFKYGSGASATSYTRILAPGETYELPVPCYTGIITAMHPDGGTGNAQLTEEVYA